MTGTLISSAVVQRTKSYIPSLCKKEIPESEKNIFPFLKFHEFELMYALLWPSNFHNVVFF